MVSNMASNINSIRFLDYFAISVLPRAELPNTLFELTIIWRNFGMKIKIKNIKTATVSYFITEYITVAQWPEGDQVEKAWNYHTQ